MELLFRSTAWAWALTCLLGLATTGATTAPDSAGNSALDTTTALQPAALAATADSLPGPAPALAEEGVPYLAMMVKLGLGLALVILLAWGTVFLLRKSAFGQQFGTAGNSIRVVERFYLGPKKAIYLVEIGGRPLALGVTDAAITPLAQWQPGELELSPRPAPPSSFAAQFRQLLGAQRPAGQEG